MEHILVSFIPYIPSTSFGGTPPLHYHLYLKLNWKDMVAALSVVKVLAEVAEAVAVVHVVDMVV